MAGENPFLFFLGHMCGLRWLMGSDEVRSRGLAPSNMSATQEVVLTILRHCQGPFELSVICSASNFCCGAAFAPRLSDPLWLAYLLLQQTRPPPSGLSRRMALAAQVNGETQILSDAAPPGDFVHSTRKFEPTELKPPIFFPQSFLKLNILYAKPYLHHAHTRFTGCMPVCAYNCVWVVGCACVTFLFENIESRDRSTVFPPLLFYAESVHFLFIISLPAKNPQAEQSISRAQIFVGYVSMLRPPPIENASSREQS